MPRIDNNTGEDTSDGIGRRIESIYRTTRHKSLMKFVCDTVDDHH